MPRVHILHENESAPSIFAFDHYARKLSRPAMGYSRAVYEHTELSIHEMEGARYRTALINGCAVCRTARAGRDFDTYMPGSDTPLERPMSTRGELPSEEFYAAVEGWRTSPLFSERERIAIEFAERMGEAPQSFAGDEAFWRRIKSHFDDNEIVDLTLSIGSWIAFGRATHILELDSLCVLPSAK